MESQQDNHKSQFLISEKEVNYILLGIIILILLGFWIFSTTSIELTCSRSYSNSIECSLVRTTPLLKMNAIKILNPQAVDVIKHQNKGAYSYSAEIRADQVSYTLPILSTFNYELARDTADKINDFLLRSDASSFFIRFPEKTK